MGCRLITNNGRIFYITFRSTKKPGLVAGRMEGGDGEAVAVEYCDGAAYSERVFYIDGARTVVVRGVPRHASPEFGWATRTTNKRVRDGRTHHSRRCAGGARVRARAGDAARGARRGAARGVRRAVPRRGRAEVAMELRWCVCVFSICSACIRIPRGLHRFRDSGRRTSSETIEDGAI